MREHWAACSGITRILERNIPSLWSPSQEKRQTRTVVENRVLCFEGIAQYPEYFSFVAMLVRSNLDCILSEGKRQSWVGYKGLGEQRLIVQNSDHEATCLYLPQTLQLYSSKPGGPQNPVVDRLDGHPIVYEISSAGANELLAGEPFFSDQKDRLPFVGHCTRGPSIGGNLNVSDIWGKKKSRQPMISPR